MLVPIAAHLHHQAMAFLNFSLSISVPEPASEKLRVGLEHRCQIMGHALTSWSYFTAVNSLIWHQHEVIGKSLPRASE